MDEEKILDKIQKLINQANDVGQDTPEGRAFAAKADAMMQAHRLDEAALRARNAARGFAETKRHEPTHIKLDWVRDSDPFYPVHIRNVAVLVRLAGVKIIFISGGRIHVFGMPNDVDYFRMLWLNVHMTFSAKLNPEWNRGLPPHKQIRAFVEAGYKWDDIWDRAAAEGQPFTREAKGETIRVPRPPADNGWMKRQLAKAYAETGEEKPKLTHDRTDYRNSFANAFGEAFQSRVWDMIFAREEAERQIDNGATLVLASDVDAVQRLMDSIYPPEMLSSTGYTPQLQGSHAGAAARGRTAASMVDMSGGRGGVGGRGPAGALGN